MPTYEDVSTDFTKRPEVPGEYVDTADLVEAVTGQRPKYFFDVNAGEWCISHSPEGGPWPEVYGEMRGVAASGDGVSLMFNVHEERHDGRRGFWLHLHGDFGELRCWLDGDDARLWAKLLKKAAKRVDR